MSAIASQDNQQKEGNLPSVGAYLRRVRKEHQMSISQLSELTKIRCEHIASIEDDERPKGIPSPYYRGYIRCYCKFFGLDTEAILKQVDIEEYQVPRSAHDEINAFKVRQMQGKIPRSSSPSSSKSRDSNTLSPLRVVLIATLLLLGVFAYQHLPLLTQIHNLPSQASDTQYDSIIHIS